MGHDDCWRGEKTKKKGRTIVSKIGEARIGSSSLLLPPPAFGDERRLFFFFFHRDDKRIRVSPRGGESLLGGGYAIEERERER